MNLIACLSSSKNPTQHKRLQVSSSLRKGSLVNQRTKGEQSSRQGHPNEGIKNQTWAEERPNQCNKLHAPATHASEEIEKKEQNEACSHAQETRQQAFVPACQPIQAQSRQGPWERQPVRNPAGKHVRNASHAKTDHQDP